MKNLPQAQNFLIKERNAMKNLMIAVFLVALAGTSSGAHAAPDEKRVVPVPKVAAPPPVASAAKPASGGKKQVIRFDAVTIAGEAKKPQVYYLLNRKKIEIGHQPITWDFLPEIPQSVEDEPF